MEKYGHWSEWCNGIEEKKPSWFDRNCWNKYSAALRECQRKEKSDFSFFFVHCIQSRRSYNIEKNAKRNEIERRARRKMHLQANIDKLNAGKTSVVAHKASLPFSFSLSLFLSILFFSDSLSLLLLCVLPHWGFFSLSLMHSTKYRQPHYHSTRSFSF